MSTISVYTTARLRICWIARSRPTALLADRAEAVRRRMISSYIATQMCRLMPESALATRGPH